MFILSNLVYLFINLQKYKNNEHGGTKVQGFNDVFIPNNSRVAEASFFAVVYC